MFTYTGNPGGISAHTRGISNKPQENNKMLLCLLELIYLCSVSYPFLSRSSGNPDCVAVLICRGAVTSIRVWYHSCRGAIS